MMGSWEQAPHAYLITKLWCPFHKTKMGSWVQAPFCQTYKCKHIVKVLYKLYKQEGLPSNCNILTVMTLIFQL